MRSLVRLLLLAGGLSGYLFPQQDARGTIVGTVTDASGAHIVGATVRVTNVATMVGVSVKTSDAGTYTAPFLATGIYVVAVEAPGFRIFLRDNVQVRIGETVSINTQMEVGDATESIEVKVDTPLLSSSEASLGQVLDQQRLQELPLFSGNVMEFALLAPGTANTTDMRIRKTPFTNAPSQFSTDGSGAFNNEFTIDGVLNTFSDGVSVRVAFSPPQSAVSEFKVQTAVFDASLGHTTGSVVNISTKGGTNKIHGDAQWVLRHSALDNPTIYDNRAGQTPPIYQDNRYSASLGGPLSIPKIHSGADRTFWYATYEGNKFATPASYTSTVPKEAWRNGDLSDLLKVGANYQLYDPATIQAGANGRFTRQPLANNIIPASRIDPVAKRILALYPMPNQTVSADGRQNFFTSGKALEDYWATVGRVDHTISEKDRLFVRVNRDYWQEDKNRSLANDSVGLILNRINRGIALDEVHMFSPTFLLNFRYGFTQQDFAEKRVSQGFDLSSLGFSPDFVKLFPKSSAIPNVGLGAITALSTSESGDGVASSFAHSTAANFTVMRGAHTLRFGPEYRLYRVFSDRHSGDTTPILTFDPIWGRGPNDNSTAPPIGAEMVSLLLGIPGGSATRSGSFATQDHYMGAYFQDDWKLNSKLTVNLGFRVEYETPVTERFDRSITQFDYSTPNPIAAAAIAKYATTPIAEIPVSNFRVNGGLTFAGVGNNSRNFWNSTSASYMPRFGLAYQLTSKTVLRGGYGMFAGSLGSFKTVANLGGFSRSTAIAPSSNNGLSFSTSLSNPLPTGLLTSLGAAGGLETQLGQALSFFPQDRILPYAQRWSFGIQRELPARFVIESSYVGNRGTNLPVNRNINATPASYLSTSPVRNQTTIDFLGAQSTNPFYGLAPQYTSTTISRANLLRPYPQFLDITGPESIGYSWYHSLQTRLERRMTKGFTLQVAHTWSKAMEAGAFLNATDPMPYESLSDTDRTHRLTGSWLWEIPVGRKRRWGANMHSIVNGVVGNWQLAGAYQRQSGQPINWGQMLITGDSNQIVLPSSERNTDRWFNTSVFNTRSQDVLASNIRTFPLRFSNIRFDTQRRLDLSLSKSFIIGERFHFRFRADAFNVENTPVLRGPDVSATSSTFGRITAQEPPRSLQVSLNVRF